MNAEARFLALVAASAAISACGGKVVFDESAGGAPGTSSHAASSAHSSTHATHSATSEAATTDVASSAASTQPGSECDDFLVGRPGTPICVSCEMCAYDSICETALNDCQSADDCVAYYECIQNCSDCDACAVDHPTGQALYAAVVGCLSCACTNNCGANCTPPPP